MATERQAVLVFSNAAVLDRARRGWPRAFEQLFECNDLVSWTNPGFDVHVFTSAEFGAIAESPRNIHYQEGSSFGERLENAVQSLTDLGYTKVVIVGSDCPDLQLGDVQLAFSALEHHRLVLGPDHRGGCYLIGLNVQDRRRLQGVRWQQNTDFEELLHRFGTENCWQLAVKLDLDTWNDIRLLARSASCWRVLATHLLRPFCSDPPSRSSKVCPRENHERLRWQLPPPPPILSPSAV